MTDKQKPEKSYYDLSGFGQDEEDVCVLADVVIRDCTAYYEQELAKKDDRIKELEAENEKLKFKYNLVSQLAHEAREEVVELKAKQLKLLDLQEVSDLFGKHSYLDENAENIELNHGTPEPFLRELCSTFGTNPVDAVEIDVDALKLFLHPHGMNHDYDVNIIVKAIASSNCIKEKK